MFGLELEASEQEFEAAKTFVKLAADAVQNAASGRLRSESSRGCPSRRRPGRTRHAPGLLSAPNTGRSYILHSAEVQDAGNGRWVWRGSKIVLFGV